MPSTIFYKDLTLDDIKDFTSQEILTALKAYESIMWNNKRRRAAVVGEKRPRGRPKKVVLPIGETPKAVGVARLKGLNII